MMREENPLDTNKGYIITFSKAAAHFLGQGVYPRGADLEALQSVLINHFYKNGLNIFGTEYRLTPSKEEANGSVSKTLLLTSDAHEILEREMARLNSDPERGIAERFRQAFQQHYDKQVWAARREMKDAITVEPMGMT
jgi:hypothetical protein